MKKAFYILAAFTFLTCFIACNGQSKQQNEKYRESKHQFDKNLVDHFPKSLINYPNAVINSQHIKKNDVKFMLYEYDVENRILDSVTNSLKPKSIAKYFSNDECLLIVNRYETLQSYENREEVIVNDTTQINKKCYEGLYPIPNFINYSYPNLKQDLRLKGNFEIYVLEAKNSVDIAKYVFLPNMQMPENWKNGYSKGVAISRDNNEIIYFLIMW